MVDPEGHTPPVKEGRSHLGESYRACQRARPRSAVTVSLSTPALARLTRSVRVEGRVYPGSGPGTGASALPLRLDSLSWALRMSYHLCLTFLTPQKCHRAVPLPVGGAALYILGSHGPRQEPRCDRSSERLVGHEV